MDYPYWESATHDTLVPDNTDLPLESCSCTMVTKMKTPPHTRIITASFGTTEMRIAMNIIQCYAPTNDSDDQIKDDFYNQHQFRTNKFRGTQKETSLRNDNTGYEKIMGHEGLGVINDNGEKFADMCAVNNLVIAGSIFPNKRIHKATWRSPD